MAMQACFYSLLAVLVTLAMTIVINAAQPEPARLVLSTAIDDATPIKQEAGQLAVVCLVGNEGTTITATKWTLIKLDKPSENPNYTYAIDSNGETLYFSTPEINNFMAICSYTTDNETPELYSSQLVFSTISKDNPTPPGPNPPEPKPTPDSIQEFYTIYETKLTRSDKKAIGLVTTTYTASIDSNMTLEQAKSAWNMEVGYVGRAKEFDTSNTFIAMMVEFDKKFLSQTVVTSVSTLQEQLKKLADCNAEVKKEPQKEVITTIQQQDCPDGNCPAPLNTRTTRRRVR